MKNKISKTLILRNVTLAIMILLGYVLQTTLFQTLNFAGISPNILIIITASYGFMFGRRYGMVTGFICGLLMDVFYGDVMGFYALIYLYIGAGNGLFNSIFYQDDIKLPLGLITASDFVYSLVCYVLMFVLRGRFDFVYYLREVIIPETVYTLLVTIFFYPCILVINKSIEDIGKNNRKRGDQRLAKKD